MSRIVIDMLVISLTLLNPTGSDEEPSPVELRVNNCTTPPCKFVRGKEMAAEVDFIPGE
jgi:hypothetical protein